MHRIYEIIEVLPSGSPQLVTIVSGVEFAKVALQSLAERTHNECFAADTRTRQVVMQLNVPSAKLRAAKRIFQIAYDESLAIHRTELLKSAGYTVMWVVGNDAAKVVLSSALHYDLFIVGHGAPKEARRGIIDLAQDKLCEGKTSSAQPTWRTSPGRGFQCAARRSGEVVVDCRPALAEIC